MTSPTNRKRPDDETLRRLRFEQGLCNKQIARLYDVHPGTVKNWFRGGHIPRRTKTDSILLLHRALPHLTRPELAARVGATGRAVLYACQKHGINPPYAYDWRNQAVQGAAA